MGGGEARDGICMEGTRVLALFPSPVGLASQAVLSGHLQELAWASSPAVAPGLLHRPAGGRQGSGAQYRLAHAAPLPSLWAVAQAEETCRSLGPPQCSQEGRR